jgi:hypothetical protein
MTVLFRQKGCNKLIEAILTEFVPFYRESKDSYSRLPHPVVASDSGRGKIGDHCSGENIQSKDCHPEARGVYTPIM